MFAGLTSDEIWMFIAVSVAASFFVGNAMNTLLGEQGFGVVGNMLVLLTGFAVGLNIVDYMPIGRVPSIMVIPAAAAVAFAILFVLAVFKRLVRPT
ncbi:hypothetical protein [Hoeflea sp.]|uniref:hypothetical protein n=1 Tax=Hoeflea sp. TaxID=1940281 RepID=UPI003BB104F7